jgi:hypothetical protein
VCFVVHKTTSELECTILTTMYFTATENTDSWHARKGDLQHAFPLDVSMVYSSMLAVSTDGECLTCSDFSLGETVHFGSLEFIVDCFGDLSLSPSRNESSAAFMGSPHNGPPTLLQAMIEHSTVEFFTASSEEGGSSLPPP